VKGVFAAVVTAALVSIPHSAICRSIDEPQDGQSPKNSSPADQMTAANYTPATPSDRVDWAVSGTIGLRSLLVVGPLSAGFETAINEPEEWHQTWQGFGKRYLHREADVAISNTIEAGLGAIWGEEPRYIPSGRKGIWPRARYAMKTAVLAQRPDGRLAPAWGRIAGNTLNNVIENSWLPPSSRTVGNTLLRSAFGFLSRMGGNAWEEYWPDVWRKLRHR